MTDNRPFLIAIALLLVLALVFLALYTSEKKQREDIAFLHLNSVHCYIHFLILPEEEWTETEWDQRISWLLMASPGAGLDPLRRHGDAAAYTHVIHLLSRVSYEHCREAVVLIDDLQIMFDTGKNRVHVLGGDIDQVIRELELLVA